MGGADAAALDVDGTDCGGVISFIAPSVSRAGEALLFGVAADGPGGRGVCVGAGDGALIVGDDADAVAFGSGVMDGERGGKSTALCSVMTDAAARGSPALLDAFE